MRESTRARRNTERTAPRRGAPESRKRRHVSVAPAPLSGSQVLHYRIGSRAQPQEFARSANASANESANEDENKAAPSDRHSGFPSIYMRFPRIPTVSGEKSP